MDELSPSAGDNKAAKANLQPPPEKINQAVELAKTLLSGVPFEERDGSGGGPVTRRTKEVERKREISHEPEANRNWNVDQHPNLALVETQRNTRLRRSIFRPLEYGPWSPSIYTLVYYKSYAEQGHAGRDVVSFTLDTANGRCFGGGDEYISEALGLNDKPPIDVLISLLQQLTAELNPTLPEE